MFRVSQFFSLDGVHEDDKVKMVFIHLHDKALTWHLQFVKTHGGTVVWNVYDEAILKRFGPEDPMAELKNLSISLFIVGLPASIELNVRMFRPKSLSDAFSLASLQEATLALCPKSTTTTLALPVPNTQIVNKYSASEALVQKKLLSQKEFAEKRAKNLCFYCDKKYVSGHKCEGQMFALEIKGVEGEECLEEEEPGMIEHELSEPVYQHIPHISLNDLSGVPTHNTMRLKGHVLKQILHILMDSDNTHNFLDLYIAKKMGCKIRSTCPLQVTVADGNKIVSHYMVKAFQWKIQRVLFEADVMLLPLGGVN
ncbi:hypothetical protein Tco_0361214 [Tanacetum coccineum]